MVWTRQVPDKCPVIRVNYPQWRRAELVAQLSVPLHLLVLAWFHTSVIAHAAHIVTRIFTVQIGYCCGATCRVDDRACSSERRLRYSYSFKKATPVAQRNIRGCQIRRATSNQTVHCVCHA
jgi:hypothetical protein